MQETYFTQLHTKGLNFVAWSVQFSSELHTECHKESIEESVLFVCWRSWKDYLGQTLNIITGSLVSLEIKRSKCN